MKSIRKVSLLSAALALSLLSACATINSISSTAGVVENNTIQFAAAEYITQAGNQAAQLARAQKVKAIAVEIQGLDTGTVTIAQLEAAVQADIAKLSPPDQILATGLLQIIVANLSVQAQTGLLNTALTAEVNQVMNDVIAATKLFGV
jgi:hypothetical protein